MSMRRIYLFKDNRNVSPPQFSLSKPVNGKSFPCFYVFFSAISNIMVALFSTRSLRTGNLKCRTAPDISDVKPSYLATSICSEH